MNEKMRKRAARGMYDNAKDAARQALGGVRAFAIHGPTIRRMAIADAIFTTLALLDEGEVTDEVHRDLSVDLFEYLTDDGGDGWL